MGTRRLSTLQQADFGDILLSVSLETLAEQAYVLHINSSVASVTGGDFHGLAFGTASLVQLLCVQYQNLVALPHVTIEDKPDTPYRGFMVDVSRALVTSDDLREAIVFCRFYKVPYLHLHLTDDHAWTFPSSAFPSLGDENVGFMAPCPYVYSKEELQDLVAFADARGVTLVPELEGPGHSGAMRRSQPVPFQGAGSDQPSGGGVLNVCSEACYEGMRALVKEYAEIFSSSPYLHVGCDEVNTGEFEDIPGYQEFVKRHDLSGPDDLFAYYVSTMVGFVQEVGKTAIVWEGASLDRTDPKAALVMVWRGSGADASLLGSQGFRLINCPNTMGSYEQEYSRSLYDFGDGQEIPQELWEQVLGGQANMWETGWGKGIHCYSVSANQCINALEIESALHAGQLWWGHTAPVVRPPYLNYSQNWAWLEGVHGRLRYPQCAGPGPQNACSAQQQEVKVEHVGHDLHGRKQEANS